MRKFTKNMFNIFNKSKLKKKLKPKNTKIYYESK